MSDSASHQAAVAAVRKWLKVSKQTNRMGAAARQFVDDLEAGRNVAKWANANVDQMLPYRTQAPRLLLIVRAGALVISAIALLAASVGIMNIMLVSVTERTKEIGIRKSIGARSRSILMQFLIEAVVLSLSGGMVGILLGVVTGNALAVWLNAAVVFPWDWAAIGLLTCTIIGVTAGLYPALKAARLDPIESLRYE